MIRLLACLLILFALPALSTTVPKATTITINAASGACPVTAGTLTLNVSVPRSSGISPFLVFYDATATTDSNVSANMVPFQDVTFTWNFGDGGTSGTSTWAYGSNPGNNSRNVATGGSAAHLYITAGADTSYTATVTAKDQAGNTASCTVPAVTAYDPSGTNGFPGSATTCFFNSTVGSGCPAGATQTTASTFAAVNANLSGKRLLYKCGDTFTGDNETISGTKASVGAYGGCESTQTNRPIFQDTSTNNHINLAAGTPGATDVRIADIDCESSGSTSAGCIAGGFGPPNFLQQITISNVVANNGKQFVNWGAGTQMGVIGSVQGPGANTIAMHFNTNENNCVNGNTTFQCGQGGSAVYVNIQYNAALGNSIFGAGSAGGGGTETFRVEACRMCVIENNTLNNSNSIGSNLKFHSGNTSGSLLPWLGQYNEYFVIADNETGPLGASGLEIAPQNAGTDERLRFGVIERNVLTGNTSQQGYTQCWVSGQNISLRDNAFNMLSSASLYPQEGCHTLTRGANNYPAWLSQFLEVYNNTCVVTGTAQGGQNCINNTTAGGFLGANNSVFRNNMFFISNGGAVVSDTGTGNTISNNTPATTANPGFTNGSGTLGVISDFKPTANFTGGTSVPVFFDALGVLWPPTWDLGAVHH